MKKKPAVKGKASTANHKKTKLVTKPSNSRVLKMSRPAAAAKPVPAQDPKFQQALENYQVGLKAMQERKFDKAKTAFQKITSAGPRELADRANVFLNTCNQQLARLEKSTFKTVEEHYDYAVSLINVGDYVAAREHLDKIIKQSPQADFGWYGLAILNCLTGHYEEALKQLADAIRLNPKWRFQARNDSDFKNLSDDPRFTELIYPEL